MATQGPMWAGAAWPVTAGMEWSRLVSIGGVLQAWIGAVASAMARHPTAGTERSGLAIQGIALFGRHGTASPGLACFGRHGVDGSAWTARSGRHGVAWLCVPSYSTALQAWQVNPRIRKDGHSLALLVWSGCERLAWLGKSPTGQALTGRHNGRMGGDHAPLFF